MTLENLKSREKGIITKIKGRGAFRRRIMEMGFVKGKEVTVIKNAPLKDPVEYKIMGYEVSLRRTEADLIEVITPSELKLSGSHYNGVIDNHKIRKAATEKSKIINIALVGNPNSGKTTLFNCISKSNERVGNYAGVTIDSKESKISFQEYKLNIIDLPGTYSLSPYSPEEIFVRNYILNKMPDVVINIVDASNLERNLYLTTQLIDMDIKMVIALNMYDELDKKGDEFDFVYLGKMLGIPIIPTVSCRSKGIDELFIKAIEVYEDKDPNVRHVHLNYGPEIEQSINKIQEIIWKDKSLTDKVSSRFFAINLLKKDREIEKYLSESSNSEEIKKTADIEIQRLENNFYEDTETLITEAKYGFINGALTETFKPKPDISEKLPKSSKIDRFLTHKYLGFPIFIFFLWIMFQATFSLGAYPVEWIEWLVSQLSLLIHNIIPDSIIKDLLVDGIIGGVGGVIVFLPNILILFFFISLMEDTGYMARVAFIMDKLMHLIGLHGRSFIPLIMGFGCNVPAIMATRTIRNRNDRLLTMLIIPFMSCSARLPVYILIAGAIFPGHAGNVIFSIYLIGILLSIIVAIVFKKTLFKAKEVPFVMELPPYRIPTMKAT
ncbi:MAG: ferrous iron transport protein B, partial [Bacteroidales bacterium]|nr:ferrous iron transport protein B [Bacteroidales bacterium]